MTAEERIYITHCSAKKAVAYRESREETTPDLLYTAMPLQRFVKRCVSQGVPWAIFSDLYSVWFPNQRHCWYEKAPRSVSLTEFEELLSDFDSRLAAFDEIQFYHNPGRFHPLYEKLIRLSGLRNRIVLFTHLNEICRES